MELADQLGFEGICVNEHHQNAYGNMPSPNIMAACLARRTQQAKLVILGNVLPLYDHPQRVAKELAMLDVITKGRVISGVEKGGYVVVGSPETVRQRLADYAKRVGFGVLVANFSVGNVPSELTQRSMTLFAKDVMPKLRPVNSDAPPGEAAGR